MWTDSGCLAMIFLQATALVATLALRSAWKRRLEPPLTTLRIVSMVLLLIVAALAAILTRNDGLLIPLIGVVFISSLGYLIIQGL